MKSIRPLATVGAIGLCAMLAACGSAETGADAAGSDSAEGESTSGPIEITADEACAEPGKVTLWGNTDPPDSDAQLAVFNETYPDITVDFVQTDDALRVLTELQAGKDIEVDIITGNLAELAPLLPHVADADLATLGIPEHAIFDVADKQIARIHRNLGGLAYDTTQTSAEDLPDTWAELIDSAYEGQYMVDPRGVYTAPLVVGMGEEEFQSWFDELVEVVKPAKVESATPQLSKILTHEFVTGDAGRAGEVAEQQDSGAPMELKYLDMIPAFDVYAFVLDGPDNNAALCYLNWLDGPEGLDIKFKTEGKTNDPEPPAEEMPEGSVVIAPANEEEAELVQDAANYVADKLS